MSSKNYNEPICHAKEVTKMNKIRDENKNSLKLKYAGMHSIKS